MKTFEKFVNFLTFSANPDCRKALFDLVHPLRPFGSFVGNGLDRSVPLYQKHDITGNHAPFGAILCAARGQMCGWVETHPYNYPGNGPFYKLMFPHDGQTNS